MYFSFIGLKWQVVSQFYGQFALAGPWICGPVLAEISPYHMLIRRAPSVG
jgi:hypothetical protein